MSRGLVVIAAALAAAACACSKPAAPAETGAAIERPLVPYRVALGDVTVEILAPRDMPQPRREQPQLPMWARIQPKLGEDVFDLTLELEPAVALDDDRIVSRALRSKVTLRRETTADGWTASWTDREASFVLSRRQLKHGESAVVCQAQSIWKVRGDDPTRIAWLESICASMKIAN